MASDVEHFQHEEIQFLYPSNWTRQVDETEDGMSVSLQSEGISFAVVGIYSDEYEPRELVDEAIASLREEHPGLETEDIAGTKGKSVEVEGMFLSIDMLSYCWIRGWRVGARSLVIFMQSIEPESRMSRAVFQALCQSVEQVPLAR